MWNQYWSWFRYSYELMVVNQWRDVTKRCDTDNCLSDPSLNSSKTGSSNGTTSTLPPIPDYHNGKAVIEDLGFNEDHVPFDFGMLVVLDILFRFLAYVCLLIRTRII